MRIYKIYTYQPKDIYIYIGTETQRKTFIPLRKLLYLEYEKEIFYIKKYILILEFICTLSEILIY